ncbi:MAG: hypothetical protein IKR68_05930 [Lachnospiraceae bacterium]|nr:hypothetical protein [Lachnospiraceae bacterium]
METRTLNSKRNIIAGGLCNCLLPVFGLIVNASVVRCLSVEYLGLAGTFNAVLQVLNLAELGFSTAMTVNLYRPLKDDDVPAVRGMLGYFRRVYRIIGLVILVLGVMVCPFLGKLVKDSGKIGDNIIILYILFLVNKAITFLLYAHKEALLNALQRFDIIKLVHIIAFAVKSCLQILAVVVFRNFYFFAAALILGTVLYNVAMDILSKKKFPQYYPEGSIDDELKLTVKRQVAGLSVANVLGVSRDSLNSILITSFFGLYIAGKYSNYCTIYDAVIGFFLVTTKAVMASIGNSIVSESVEKNYENLTKMEFLQNIVTTASTAYLLSLYQPFMKVWMGEELLFPDPVMITFVLYFYIRAMSEVRNAYFSALGYWWKAKWIFVTEAVVVIILMVILGRLLGVAGIILAPCVSVLTVNYIGITNLMFREYFKTGPGEYYRNRVVYTVITVLVSAAAWKVCDLVPYEGIAGIAVRLLSCTLVLAIMIPALMYLLKREYMKESVSFVRQIITAKR